VPFVERRVPVIADDRVEMSFGTGASRLRTIRPTTRSAATMSSRADRDGPDGPMNDEAGELAGLTQVEADERILAWLREHD
jgi:valyl-tRNA synthetase